MKGEPKVLEGIRVVDFCHGGVGPLVAKFLADAGAQVIKVETHTRTEVMRRTPPYKQGIMHVDGSAQFAAYNNNKLDVTLNLKHPKGQGLAKRLVATADIVADSFTPGVMKRLGLGYEELTQVKPDIIMISMSFAGQTGPYGHQRGHGPILAALTGLPGLVGWNDGPPIAPGTAYTDFYLPHVFTCAILEALLHRDETGEGCFLDASDLEAAIDVLGTAPLDYVVNGRSFVRLGNRHEWAVPHGCYPCRGEDRWCAIAVFDDQEWQNLCSAMRSPELVSDERFATLAKRRENEDELDALIGRWTSGQDAGEVMRLLQESGVRAGVVQNSVDTLNDPQLRSRQHFWEVENDPNRDWFTYEKEGFLLPATPLRIERGAPRLGQDNYYVLHDLIGVPDDELAELIAEGAVE